ncbi:hypothetical protein L6452_13321 [Arctium lappa]|uniref:Uncharacterized protein n=1 Tax=Arctium lappa TaxID=4217 RepID=A0ACB9CI86_ARCLA|nr:hypothetical protein L6452_13321 [Arctium lappa]
MGAVPILHTVFGIFGTCSCTELDKELRQLSKGEQNCSWPGLLKGERKLHQISPEILRHWPRSLGVFSMNQFGLNYFKVLLEVDEGHIDWTPFIRSDFLTCMGLEMDLHGDDISLKLWDRMNGDSGGPRPGNLPPVCFMILKM